MSRSDRIPHFALIALAMLAAPAAGARPVIDFRAENTLLPIFEAGLHPRNQSGLETRKCYLRDGEIELLLPGDVRIPVIYESAGISVWRNGRISTIQFVSDYLTADEAYTAAAEIHRQFGKPLDALREYLDSAEGARWVGDNPYGFRVEGTPRVSTGFLWGVDARPFRLTFHLDWKMKRTPDWYRTEPIHPPPGYEHLPMEPLPPPFIRKRNAERAAADDKAPVSALRPRGGGGQPDPPAPAAGPPEEVTRRPALLLVLLFTVAASLVIIFLRLRVRRLKKRHGGA